MGLWSHGISIFGRWDTRKLNLSVHVQWPGERPCGVVIRRQLSPSPEEKPHQKPNQLTLTLDFWPAELWENEFKLTVKPPSLWSWLPRLTNTAGTISVCAQSCPALCDSMDCSLPGFSVHGIFQARTATGVGCHFLLRGIFLAQRSNPRLLHLLHWRRILYHYCHLGSFD